MTRAEARLIAQEIVKEQIARGLIEDKVIGVEEVAEILGCKVQTVYNHIKEIPCTKFGGKLRFFRSDIFRMIRR